MPRVDDVKFPLDTKLSVSPLKLLLCVGLLSYIDVSAENSTKSSHKRKISASPPAKGGLCDPKVRQTHGYYNVDPKNPARKYFFWFFESRFEPSTDPIFLWLEGGPGESGLASAVGYNGPCIINKDGATTSINPYSWTNRANGIWLDQPVGVGFSKGSPAEETPAETAENIYRFLEAFFGEFPQYKGDFYLAGTSYAGTLLPRIAHALKQGSTPPIKVKGIIFQNTMINASAQYPSYPEMAYKSGVAKPVINEKQYNAMNAGLPKCLKQIDLCTKNDGLPCDDRPPSCINDTDLALPHFRLVSVKTCPDANEGCKDLVLGPLVENGVDFYKIGEKCSDPHQSEPAGCYDEDLPRNVPAYYGQSSVKLFLGVRGSYIIDSDPVFYKLNHFVLVNSDFLLPNLLDKGLRVLVIAGDRDYICNFIGLKRWMLGLKWAGQSAFNKASDVVYKDTTGQVIGLRRSINRGQYCFVQVSGGSHGPVTQNPRGVLDTVNDFFSSRS